MKRSRFSEEQVAYALRQVEAGTPVGMSRSRRDSEDPRAPWPLPIVTEFRPRPPESGAAAS